MHSTIMERLFTTLFGTGTAALGTVFGQILDGSTHVTLGTVVSVCSVVFPVVWVLSSRLSKIEASQKDMKDDIAHIFRCLEKKH